LQTRASVYQYAVETIIYFNVGIMTNGQRIPLLVTVELKVKGIIEVDLQTIACVAANFMLCAVLLLFIPI
jgi:hypothetical protein